MAVLTAGFAPFRMPTHYVLNGYEYLALSSITEEVSDAPNLVVRADYLLASNDPNDPFNEIYSVEVVTNLSISGDRYSIQYSMRDLDSGQYMVRVTGVVGDIDEARAFDAVRTDDDLFEIFLDEDDTLNGSPFDDHLRGFRGQDRLEGFGGDDYLVGDGGDSVFGGVGDDLLESYGGTRNDLNGGAGDDVLRVGYDYRFGFQDSGGLSFAENLLTGGVGSDRFEIWAHPVFSRRLSDIRPSRITDFDPDEDVISFEFGERTTYDVVYLITDPERIPNFSRGSLGRVIEELKEVVLEISAGSSDVIFSSILDGKDISFDLFYGDDREPPLFQADNDSTENIFVAGFDAIDGDATKASLNLALRAAYKIKNDFTDPEARPLVEALFSGETGEITIDGEKILLRAAIDDDDSSRLVGLQFEFEDGFNVAFADPGGMSTFFGGVSNPLPREALDPTNRSSFIITAGADDGFSLRQNGDDVEIRYADRLAAIVEDTLIDRLRSGENLLTREVEAGRWPWDDDLEDGTTEVVGAFRKAERPGPDVWRVDGENAFTADPGADFSEGEARTSGFYYDGSSQGDPDDAPVIIRNGSLLQTGGGGDDQIAVTGVSAVVLGLDGDDVLEAKTPSSDRNSFLPNRPNLVDGGDGNDIIVGNGFLFGGDGDDDISLGADDINGYLGVAAYGEAGADRLTGGEGFDHLVGGDGDDVIDGARGADLLQGGAGNDEIRGRAGEFIGGSGDDTITSTWGGELYGGDGDDFITSASRGEVFGGNGDDVLVGGRHADGGPGNDHLQSIEGTQLYGGEGDDTLIGNPNGGAFLNGGPGADHMIGGVGRDTYYIDHPLDRIEEPDGNSNDSIRSTIGFVLPDNIENFELIGGGAYDITGNASANILEGNSNPAENTIYGLDGVDEIYAGPGDTAMGGNSRDFLYDSRTGSSILIGGHGPDIYYNDDGDTTFHLDLWDGENAIRDLPPWEADGFDIVYSPFLSYRNYAEQFHLTGDEALDLIGGGGANDYWGNDQPNGLFGYDGNDKLHGGGGDDVIEGGRGHDLLDGEAGDDLMIGGSHNDTYYVDSPGDVVQENVNEGFDTVYTSVNFAIPENVERLRLLGREDLALQGSAEADGLYGNPGANEISAGAGDDIVYGSSGDDVLNGGADADRLYGGPGADAVNGDEGEDTLLGGSGDDALSGGADDDMLEGGANNDTLNGDDGDDMLKGDDGDDALNGGAGDDVLYGDLGGDVLTGGDGDDELHGGAGNDVYILESAADVIVEAARAGWDVVYAPFQYRLGNNVEEFRLSGDAAMNITGANSVNDVIRGNDAANGIHGYAGQDSLYGEGGDDLLAGYSGHDRLYGGDGDDRLKGHQDDDRMWGGAGADRIWGGDGRDVVFGDIGDDVILGGDGNDNIFAHAGDDQVSGEAGNDVLRGHEGDDILDGGDGDDVLLGGDGEDVLEGGAGLDRLFGGDGGDLYHVRDNGDSIREYGRATGFDRILVEIDNYKSPYHIEEVRLVLPEGGVLHGSFHNDNMIGDVGDDFLKGYTGHDVLAGAAGDDTLFGHGGFDVLRGGDGDDLLRGGLGRDKYYGDAGSDRFLLEVGGDIDRIYDFEVGVDVLDLRPFDLPDFAAFQAIAETRTSGFTYVDLDNGDAAILYGIAAEDLTDRDVLV